MSDISSIEKISQLPKIFPDSEYPPISVIVPTFNSAQKIGITIESLINQHYPDFEILVIDGGSTDRTLEMVKGYRQENIHLCSVSGSNRYEMINKGISLSKGVYINTLFPGDYYIHRETLRIIMEVVMNDGEPDLVYCGSLLREAQKEVKILFRPLNLHYLKRGQQPTSLQSCWFHLNTFKEIGKFNTGYALRGGYELLCRFLLHGRLTHLSTNRVLTDYDLRGVTRGMVVRHFGETAQIILKYFGPGALTTWFFVQTDVKRYFRLWWRSFKIAVFGTKTPQD